MAEPAEGAGRTLAGRRVVHTAVIGEADAIVTEDTRSGMETSESLSTASVEVVRPYDFAATTIIAPQMPATAQSCNWRGAASAHLPPQCRCWKP